MVIDWLLFPVTHQICGGDKPYLHPDTLQVEHDRCMEMCLDLFHSTRKMGGPEFCRAYEEQLKEDLTESFANFSRFVASVGCIVKDVIYSLTSKMAASHLVPTGLGIRDRPPPV